MSAETLLYSMASSKPKSLAFDFSQVSPSSPPETPLAPAFSSQVGKHPTLDRTAPKALPYIQSLSPEHNENRPMNDLSLARAPKTPSSNSSSSSGISFEDLGTRSTDRATDSAALGTQDDSRPESARATRQDGFTVEEILEGDIDYDSDTEILRPDLYEDADSDRVKDDRSQTNSYQENFDLNTEMIDEFENMRCKEDEEESDGQQRRYRRKKQRWSIGKLKRSYSQSVGSDSDADDDKETLDAYDVGPSARRLRRRVGDPGDRSSSLFEDSIDLTVAELEEPQEEDAEILPASFQAELDLGPSGLEALPFWVMPDPMELDANKDD